MNRLAGALLVAVALCAACPGQEGSAAVQPMATAEVLLVMNADRFDSRAFGAIVAANARAVPGLLVAIGDAVNQRPEVVRCRERALRAVRLIGPSVADQVVPKLLASLSRNMEREDVALLDTLRTVAPGVLQQGTRDLIADVKLPAPKPQLDMAAFKRWCSKMRLWYDFKQRLDWRSSGDVDKLIGQLLEEDANGRRFAAEHLGKLGAAAKGAIDALVVATQTKHPRVTRLTGTGSMTTDFHDLIQDEAAIAIARIDPAHVEARRGLTLLLEADDSRERFAALMAMSEPIGADAFDVVPAVLAAIDSDEDRIAGEAITTLARLGDARKDVMERLRKCAVGGDGLAKRAASALRTLMR